MAKHPLPTPEQLRQLLRYDPETGRLYWRHRDLSWFNGCPSCTGRWNKKHAGKEALPNIGNHGYRTGSILSKGVLAHRVIAAMHADKWPERVIDHINGDPLDNRLENLREVTTTENSRNRAMDGRNKSGTMGVNWDKSRQKWYAKINGDGRQISLGKHVRLEDAVEARQRAEIVHGYHENHGRDRVEQ